MNDNMTVSMINEKAMQASHAYANMADRTDEQRAESIARHYLSHAQIARALLTLIEQSKYQDMSPTLRTNVNLLIAQYVETITKNHLYDFGLPLEWREWTQL